MVALLGRHVACDWSRVSCWVHAGTTGNRCTKNSQPQTAHIAHHWEGDDEPIGYIHGPDRTGRVNISLLHIPTRDGAGPSKLVVWKVSHCICSVGMDQHELELYVLCFY